MACGQQFQADQALAHIPTHDWDSQESEQAKNAFLRLVTGLNAQEIASRTVLSWKVDLP